MLAKKHPEFSLGSEFKEAWLEETREIRGFDAVEEYVLQPGDEIPVPIPGLAIAPAGIVGQG